MLPGTRTKGGDILRIRKNDLLRFIKAHDHVNFEDIEKFFSDIGVKYKGTTGILLEHSKLVAWNGWNREASLALMELVDDGAIEMIRVNMCDAPMPPAFRGVKRLSLVNYVPIIIKAKRR